MTFVAAKRFGRRIIMVADTKISDRTGIIRPGQQVSHAHDYIPGRLKSFPLSLKISVGYAGPSAQALDIIRKIAKDVDTTFDLAGVLRMLSEGSSVLRKGHPDDHVDFIVVSHVNGPEIFKIWKEGVSADQESHWIGDSKLVSLHLASIEEQRIQHQRSVGNYDLSEEYGNAEERLFTGAWVNLLVKDSALSDSVGGLPVILLGSPHGHCFQMGAAAYSPGPIRLTSRGEVFNEDGQPVDSLYGQYSFSAVVGAKRGVALLGIWLQESRTAYLYEPLTADEPVRYYPATMKQLIEIVSLRDEELDGAIID